MASFPTTIPTAVHPNPTDPTTAPSASGTVGGMYDEVVALATKVGINSSGDTNSIDYKLAHVTVAPGAEQQSLATVSGATAWVYVAPAVHPGDYQLMKVPDGSGNWACYKKHDSTPYFPNADPAISATQCFSAMSGVGGCLVWGDQSVPAKSPVFIADGCTLWTAAQWGKPTNPGPARYWNAVTGFAADYLVYVGGDSATVDGGQFDVNSLNATTNTAIGYGCMYVSGNRNIIDRVGTYGNKQSAAGDNNSYSFHNGKASGSWSNQTISAWSWASNVLTLTVGSTTGMVAGDPVHISGNVPSSVNNVFPIKTVVNATQLTIPVFFNPGTLTTGGTITAGSGQSADGMCSNFDFRCPDNTGTAASWEGGDWNISHGHVHGAGTGTRMAYIGGHNGKMSDVHFEAGGSGAPTYLLELDAATIIAESIFIGQNNGSNGLHLTNSSSGIIDVIFFPSGLGAAANFDAIVVQGGTWGQAGWSVRAMVNASAFPGNAYRWAINVATASPISYCSSVTTGQNANPWSNAPMNHKGNIHNGASAGD